MKLQKSLLLTGLVAGFSNTVLADAWQQSFHLDTGVSYDDNINMSSTNEQDVWKGILKPKYTLKRVKDTDILTGSLAYNIERADDSNLSQDREDPTVNLDWTRQLLTGSFSLGGSYSESSTRYTEFDDTGDLTQDATRQNGSLYARYNHALSDRLSYDVSLDFQDVNYDGGTFTEYQDTSAGFTLNYQWDEVTRPYARLSYSEYEPQTGSAIDSDQTNLAFGVDWQATETYNVNANGGYRLIERGGQEDDGWSADLRLTRTGEYLNSTFSYSRSASPSGDGNYSEADQVKYSLNYSYSDYTTIDGSINWRNNRSETNDTETLNFMVGASHELSEFWRARLSYNHKIRETTTTANGNVIMASLIYNLPEF